MGKFKISLSATRGAGTVAQPGTSIGSVDRVDVHPRTARIRLRSGARHMRRSLANVQRDVVEELCLASGEI